VDSFFYTKPFQSTPFSIYTFLHAFDGGGGSHVTSNKFCKYNKPQLGLSDPKKNLQKNYYSF